jgi:hypothetical protein
LTKLLEELEAVSAKGTRCKTCIAEASLTKNEREDLRSSYGLFSDANIRKVLFGRGFEVSESSIAAHRKKHV